MKRLLLGLGLLLGLVPEAYAAASLDGVIYAGPLSQPRTTATGIAAAGSNQSGATGIAVEFAEVTTATVGSADGVRLTACLPGYEVRIKNSTAGIIKVYPAVGEAIDPNATNIPTPLDSGTMAIFSCIEPSRWLSLIPATAGGGGGPPPVVVDSWNGRQNAVVPLAGDYLASLITNVPAGTLSQTNVQDAINALDTGKSATGHRHDIADIDGVGNMA